MIIMMNMADMIGNMKVDESNIQVGLARTVSAS